MRKILENSLRDSASQLPQVDLSRIFSSDISKIEQHDYITHQDIKTKMNIRLIVITALCSLVIVIGLYIFIVQRNAVHSVVTLDVSVGFTITGDSRGNVINIRGVDEASRRILRNFNIEGFSGGEIEQLAGGLIYELADQQLLTEEDPYILLSVWSRNQEHAQDLLRSVTEQANISASIHFVNPVVLGQFLDRSGSLEREAEQHGVTAGRFQIISHLMEYRPVYTLEHLLSHNIEGLLRIARVADIRLPISGYRFADASPDIDQNHDDNRVVHNNTHQSTPEPLDDLRPVPVVETFDLWTLPLDITEDPTADIEQPEESENSEEPDEPEQLEPDNSEIGEYETVSNPDERIETPEPEPEPTQSPQHTPTPQPTQQPTATPMPTPEPHRDPTPIPTPVVDTEWLWAAISDELFVLGNRQLDHWRGNPDNQTRIDEEFDALMERAARLGVDYHQMAMQRREFYQSQYETIMNEMEWYMH